MWNKVVLMGYLATTPEVKLENGKRYVEFSIAQRIRNREGKKSLYFHTIRSYSPKVENIMLKLSKGDLIYVDGVLVVERKKKKALAPVRRVYVDAQEVRLAYRKPEEQPQGGNTA